MILERKGGRVAQEQPPFSRVDAAILASRQLVPWLLRSFKLRSHLLWCLLDSHHGLSPRHITNSNSLLNPYQRCPVHHVHLWIIEYNDFPSLYSHARVRMLIFAPVRHHVRLHRSGSFPSRSQTRTCNALSRVFRLASMLGVQSLIFDLHISIVSRARNAIGLLLREHIHLLELACMLP